MRRIPWNCFKRYLLFTRVIWERNVSKNDRLIVWSWKILCTNASNIFLPFTSANARDTKGGDEGAHKDDTAEHHHSHFQSG